MISSLDQRNAESMAQLNEENHSSNNQNGTAVYRKHSAHQMESDVQGPLLCC